MIRLSTDRFEGDRKQVAVLLAEDGTMIVHRATQAELEALPGVGRVIGGGSSRAGRIGRSRT